ncbi:MAG: heavy metal-responsive transcriptional regulator [Microcoleus sp. PH2017_10_PVI_O_A]|uniref:heavy metal-responsive transcriptional regulator n=1 Tax=unclassified Microcoleus TaxID=2642155 RepID=UPI001D8FF8EE|nr:MULTISPECIES: heavy metal-responsive transcriptional regulator [unclassified Microcoleus]TAE82211.1 MAG: heavy metal-responsive transcriptional regulator [Oscillatoriales cyanobacterium]MCC3406461.1 heavy metal-responsive transcriptional regulator [Microcoleus sp. PH2017_10_PVI_O_A]MCC3459088.1 heavy metal-responsive transcriptional regulator [Microcoleus sp. PH2017_11_PCY_U_A]MCC3478960.1 heavy metal-responsive transcriptional regulator [Microcoleus sp. PH2017_12_PCY_D_A]MCC3529231.1 heavy
MNISVAEKLYKIGSVAGCSGLSVKTVRYYDEMGLLSPAVERSPAGYRLFGEAVFNRLAFIKRSQALGLSLQEIKDILQVRDRGELPCSEAKQHLTAKVEAISGQIAALETLKGELQGILNRWEEQPSPECITRTICPNIQRD